MKLLITASPDGRLDILDNLLNKHEEIDAAVCLGDSCIASESTPLEYFLRSKFRDQANIPIEMNKRGHAFKRPVYLLYGALDDPFIPKNEFGLKNVFPIWQGVHQFASYNDDCSIMKTINIGFLSGYYNIRKFKKKNSRRLKMSRERQSLALCMNDFLAFRNTKLDILFSYDSPYEFPESNNDVVLGCPQIASLVTSSQAKWVFYGHHRSFSMSVKDGITYVGLDKLINSYCIYDTYNQLLSIMNT